MTSSSSNSSKGTEIGTASREGSQMHPVHDGLDMEKLQEQLRLDEEMQDCTDDSQQSGLEVNHRTGNLTVHEDISQRGNELPRTSPRRNPTRAVSRTGKTSTEGHPQDIMAPSSEYIEQEQKLPQRSWNDSRACDIKPGDRVMVDQERCNAGATEDGDRCADQDITKKQPINRPLKRRRPSDDGDMVAKEVGDKTLAEYPGGIWPVQEAGQSAASSRRKQRRGEGVGEKSEQPTRITLPRRAKMKRLEHQTVDSQLKRALIVDQELAKWENVQREMAKYKTLTTKIKEHLPAETSRSSCASSLQYSGLEKIRNDLGNADVAAYFMAVSLLLQQTKIVDDDIPKSGKSIISPVETLLKEKHYKPCLHLDFSCKRSSCFEQWYVLYNGLDQRDDFELFKKKNLMPDKYISKKPKYNMKTFRQGFSEMKLAFNAYTIQEYDLTNLLCVKQCMDVLVSGSDEDMEFQESHDHGSTGGPRAIINCSERRRKLGRGINSQSILSSRKMIKTGKQGPDRTLRETARKNMELGEENKHHRETISEHEATISILNEKWQNLQINHDNYKVMQDELLSTEKAKWDAEKQALERQHKSSIEQLEQFHSKNIKNLVEIKQRELDDLRSRIEELTTQNQKSSSRKDENHGEAILAQENKFKRVEKELKGLQDELEQERRNSVAKCRELETQIAHWESIASTYIMTRVAWLEEPISDELKRDIRKLREWRVEPGNEKSESMYKLCEKIHAHPSIPSIEKKMTSLVHDYDRKVDMCKKQHDNLVQEVESRHAIEFQKAIDHEKATADERAEVARQNNKWFEAAQFIQAALEISGDAGLSTIEKAETRVKACLRQGQIADANVLRCWHSMRCGCDGFTVEANEVKIQDPDQCKLNMGVIPESVSIFSEQSNTCSAILRLINEKEQRLLKLKHDHAKEKLTAKEHKLKELQDKDAHYALLQKAEEENFNALRCKLEMEVDDLKSRIEAEKDRVSKGMKCHQSELKRAEAMYRKLCLDFAWLIAEPLQHDGTQKGLSERKIRRLSKIERVLSWVSETGGGQPDNMELKPSIEASGLITDTKTLLSLLCKDELWGIREITCQYSEVQSVEILPSPRSRDPGNLTSAIFDSQGELTHQKGVREYELVHAVLYLSLSKEILDNSADSDRHGGPGRATGRNTTQKRVGFMEHHKVSDAKDLIRTRLKDPALATREVIELLHAILCDCNSLEIKTESISVDKGKCKLSAVLPATSSRHIMQSQFYAVLLQIDGITRHNAKRIETLKSIKFEKEQEILTLKESHDNTMVSVKDEVHKLKGEMKSRAIETTNLMNSYGSMCLHFTRLIAEPLKERNKRPTVCRDRAQNIRKVFSWLTAPLTEDDMRTKLGNSIPPNVDYNDSKVITDNDALLSLLLQWEGVLVDEKDLRDRLQQLEKAYDQAVQERDEVRKDLERYTDRTYSVASIGCQINSDRPEEPQQQQQQLPGVASNSEVAGAECQRKYAELKNNYSRAVMEKELLVKQSQSFKARHHLMCGMLQIMQGQPTSLETFTNGLVSGKLATKRNMEKIHSILSTRREMGLSCSQSLGACKDLSCAASFLHQSFTNFQDGEETDATFPGLPESSDISRELSLLRPVGVLVDFKRGVDKRLSHLIDEHCSEAPDRRLSMERQCQDDPIGAVESMNYDKYASMLSAMEYFVEQDKKRDKKALLRTKNDAHPKDKTEDAARKAAKHGGLDAYVISDYIKARNDSAGVEWEPLLFQAPKRQGLDRDLSKDGALNVDGDIKKIVSRRCEMLISRILSLQLKYIEREKQLDKQQANVSSFANAKGPDSQSRDPHLRDVLALMQSEIKNILVNLVTIQLLIET